MGRRVGAACSPDKVGSSQGRPRRGVGVAVRWGGRLHGGERWKASSVLPPTRSVEDNNIDIHSYKHVHDETPTKTYVNMDIQSTILYMTKHIGGTYGQMRTDGV